MITDFRENGKISFIELENFKVPFTETQGFFIGENDVVLKEENGIFKGKLNNVSFGLSYSQREEYIEIDIEIKNNGQKDVTEDIGMHMGIDSYMVEYPQWHEPFFPTLLRCEKTHIWGYFMNTAENSLCIASDGAVASYDIKYNIIDDNHCGHRIIGTDLIFIKNSILPERHPQNLSVLKAGEIYKNKLYYIPVKNKQDIKPKLSEIANIPMIDAEKYTYEIGDKLNFNVINGGGYKTELILSNGEICNINNFTFCDYGVYKLKVYSDNGKLSEGMFCCRKDWDFYLYNAAKESINKPQIASTHVEGFYGLFSAFLSQKYFNDEYLSQKAYECFDEIMPLMFDFSDCRPTVIPTRIQNTALLISILVDMYEVNPEKNLKYLEYAVKFGDFIVKTQGEDGVYRNKKVHYTCVIYIAKSMLELALAEKDCKDQKIKAKYTEHYNSVKAAVDELVRDLDNIDTEGELTLEDGMISCSALQIGMFALTLPENEREKYIKAAEYMIGIHSCLEQQLIPDCRMNGCSLRYWESQYDVMIRANMLNSPHGWSAWTGYAYYYLYMLTGKKNYLLSLMNLLGSCAQLMSFEGNLRWGFCSQPYVKARTFVPDTEKPVKDGYAFVDSKTTAYRGKYEVREILEGYVDMISDWYRVGEQKVMGGYEFCPLFLENDVMIDVDNQGGCCDNDVHEIFKCIEECVLRKAYIYENEDGSFLTYGCTVKTTDGYLDVKLNDNVTEVVYNFTKPHKSNLKNDILSGFAVLEI